MLLFSDIMLYMLERYASPNGYMCMSRHAEIQRTSDNDGIK